MIAFRVWQPAFRYLTFSLTFLTPRPPSPSTRLPRGAALGWQSSDGLRKAPSVPPACRALGSPPPVLHWMSVGGAYELSSAAAERCPSRCHLWRVFPLAVVFAECGPSRGRPIIPRTFYYRHFLLTTRNNLYGGPAAPAVFLAARGSTAIASGPRPSFCSKNRAKTPSAALSHCLVFLSALL
jgi:hypothetical protein